MFHIAGMVVQMPDDIFPEILILSGQPKPKTKTKLKQKLQP
jgi:hypothetical protein